MSADDLTRAAEFMPIFPLVGALVGVLCGVLTWSLESVLPFTVVGFLSIGSILFLNGAQHFDGLLDFGDGIMCHGSRLRKLRAMRDPQTGAGGISLGLIVLSATAFAISSIRPSLVVQTLIVAEGAAKLSMLIQASRGESAHRGMSSVFVTAMHSKGRSWRLISSIFLTTLIALIGLGMTGLLIICMTGFVALLMTALSNRSFGGITGDVMGATNEITRLVSILVVVVGMRWL